MEEMKNAYNILVGKLERRQQSENLGLDGRIILRWIVGKCDWTV
jgi:hypothetical protein